MGMASLKPNNPHILKSDMEAQVSNKISEDMREFLGSSVLIDILHNAPMHE